MRVPARRADADWPRDRRRGGAHRRHADDVADDQPRVRSDAPLVHPYLAAAQDPVDMALGNALQHAGEEIVDALAGRVVADGEPVHSILA